MHFDLGINLDSHLHGIFPSSCGSELDYWVENELLSCACWLDVCLIIRLLNPLLYFNIKVLDLLSSLLSLPTKLR